MKSTTVQFQDSRVEKAMSALMCHAGALHPTVQAKRGDREVRVMLDSGAGSCYLYTDVFTTLNLKPTRKEKRWIKQMFGTMWGDVEI